MIIMITSYPVFIIIIIIWPHSIALYLEEQMKPQSEETDKQRSLFEIFDEAKYPLTVSSFVTLMFFFRDKPFVIITTRASLFHFTYSYSSVVINNRSILFYSIHIIILLLLLLGFSNRYNQYTWWRYYGEARQECVQNRPTCPRVTRYGCCM